MDENEEENAQKVVTYMALEAMREKHQKILNNAIQDNEEGHLDEYIAMQKSIIAKLKKAIKEVNNNE